MHENIYRYSAFEFSNAGNHTDELQGALIHTALVLCPWGHIIGFESDCPGCEMIKARPYEALSYTWGTDRSQEIALLPIGERASITANCAIALRVLRYKPGPTILWVDAICIDQSNVVERSAQIGLMSRIYIRYTGLSYM